MENGKKNNKMTDIARSSRQVIVIKNIYTIWNESNR